MRAYAGYGPLLHGQDDYRGAGGRISAYKQGSTEDMLDQEVRELANGLALYPKDGIAIGKVCRELMYDTMGVSRGLVEHSIMHTFQTNRVYDQDEHNFFKNRRDLGVKGAAHEKHDYYKALDK